MLTKEIIFNLKDQGNDQINYLIQKNQDVASLNFILENLGKLPKNFQGDFLFDLLNHSNKKIRLNAV